MRGRLPHLSGSRCAASLWIVCQHFVPHSKDGSLVKTLWRSNVAVDYFIVLSGFITHWASRDRKCDWRWTLRRFGRVLLSVYLSMAVAVLLLIGNHQPPSPGHVARCALLVETWIDPTRWCPNGQIWTVAALAPSWLLYPHIRNMQWYSLKLAVAATVPTAIASYVFFKNGGEITGEQHDYLYLWPPSQLLDFYLGVLAAEAAATTPASKFDANLSDACVCVVLLVCFFLPNPQLDYRSGIEPFLDHGLAPLFAGYLFFSARAAATEAGGGGLGIASRIFSHPALDSLGKCSFEVYLFQWPIHAIFVGIFGLDTNRGNGGENFVAFAIALFLVAASYEAYLERPFVAYLRRSLAPPPLPLLS